MAEDHVPIRRHTIAQVETFDVMPEELESIKRECRSVGLDFQVAQFFLTLAVSFNIALETTKIDSDRKFEFFSLLVIIGYALGAVFGIKWFFWGRKSLAAIFNRIEARQVGPTGDAAHQLQASIVAQLPPVTVPQEELERVARLAAREMVERDMPLTTREVLRDLQERGQAKEPTREGGEKP